MKKLGFIILLCLPSLLLAQSSCFDCHGEKSFSKTLDSGAEKSLYISDSTFHTSVHGGLDCVDCHTDAKGDPHPENLKKVNCGTCHEEAQAQYEKGGHGQSAKQGSGDAPTCASCHGSHDIFSSSDPRSKTYASNLPKTCGVCHSKEGVASNRELSVSEPFEKFERGIHGRALKSGNIAAASCNSCHGSHLLLPMSDPQSPINHNNLAKTCGQCHTQESEEFMNSAHGSALAKGVNEAPTCNNCHGEHEILSPTDPKSATAAANIDEQTCSPCHGLPKLNEKYGIRIDPVSSYRASYHGLATSGGSKVAANCVSCHGAHNILPSSDPRSSTNSGNLAKTCGTCHVGSTENFAKSYVHALPDSKADIYSKYIKNLYIWLIVVVIGGMVLHNFIIYLSYVRAKYRLLKMHETIRRFDQQWVIQHLMIFISFTLLVITGFALKFSDSDWATYLARIGFTEHLRGIIHRISATVLLAAGFYHLLWLFLARSAKGELKSLLPNITDVRQAVQNVKYYLGLSREKPEFARYGYVEKAEYWALVWGTAVMALTGFVLWFPTFFTTLAPAWIVKVSETIHYYEAWLATLAILLYHFFFAIFHPADYPINLASFTGKMTVEEAEEKFPAWVKSMKDKSEE